MNRTRFGLTMVALAPLFVFGGAFRFAMQRAGRAEGAGLPPLAHRLFCAALGLRLRVSGAAAPGALIVANHVSWLDIPALGSVAPMGFLAKKEVGAHPIARGLVGLQGIVLIDRARRRAIPAANRAIGAHLAAGSPLVLFAEATTGDGNRLLRFRSSHFEALRPLAQARGEALVQPVFIAYRARAGLPLGRGGRPFVAWYGDMTFAGHFRRILRDGPFECEIRFGEPIRFAPDADRKTVARLTEAAVRALAAGPRRPK